MSSERRATVRIILEDGPLIPRPRYKQVVAHNWSLSMLNLANGKCRMLEVSVIKAFAFVAVNEKEMEEEERVAKKKIEKSRNE